MLSFRTIERSLPRLGTLQRIVHCGLLLFSFWISSSTALYSQPSNQPPRETLSAIEKQQLEERALDLQVYLDNNPYSPEAHLQLANIYWQLGHVGKPIRHYAAAIKLKPDYAEAYFNLGNIFFQQGEYEQAQSSYRKAISFKPDYAEAYNGLGNSYVDAKEYEQAIENYQKALLARADFPEAQYNLCTVYIYSTEYQMAIPACQKAAENDDPRALNNLGNAYFRTNQLTLAMSAYRKALDLDPELAEAYFNIAAINLLHHDKEGALQQQKALEKLDPQKSRKLERLIEAR